MPEEHWLAKPGVASNFLGLTYGQLERRAMYLPHVVTPGGGQRLYLCQYLKEFVGFIAAGVGEGDPYVNFALTEQARALGQQGFNQFLQLMQLATEQNRITTPALAEILGVSRQGILRWNLTHLNPPAGTWLKPPVAYLASEIMQSLKWYGPGVSY